MLEVGEMDAVIVDYGMGNLFSLKNACEVVGLKVEITSDRDLIASASALILPGVGAFGDAMEALERLGLIELLKRAAKDSKPFFGICLGMQLLMTSSVEFGLHKGLGIIEGTVNFFDSPLGDEGKTLKVPHVGWSSIERIKGAGDGDSWAHTLLEAQEDGVFMYFVHSYYVAPEDKGLIVSMSSYGNVEFCSSFKSANIFACQFHPEQSGTVGLKLFKNFLTLVKSTERGG